uniref:DNA polymerase III subunit alpha n=1 Tax=Candidatus Electronema sp. TaxID=2698783 RepID=UPI004056A48C
MFTHLHVHTQYSMLDGAIRIGDLIEKTKEYGMNAVAVTDHGAMYGALEFYTKAKKAGLRPIIGCELYIAETDHLIHDKSAGHNFHLVLLAMNEDGYRNLMKLASVAQTAGFYYKPRIDRKLLAAHHEGLIALSACLHGEVPWLINHGTMDAAREKALELRQLFGDRLYFEVQENGIPEQTKVNTGLQELGHDLGIKLVATNDCHYLNKDEAYAHEVLLCIQTSKVISDQGRFKFSTDELYFKPPDVMARQFSWCPEALSNTMEVAERCDLKLKFGENHFPIFPVPAGESLESLFEHACRDGLEQRLALLRELQEVSPELEAQYRERLEMEIKVIQKMGFAGYFLIVADFINWAKSKGIPVGPGRGSGAGSLAAYCMAITDIDPIPYGLLFERFLNVERVSMPDFDVDFCKDRRDEVIDYVRQRYGGDAHVAQIVAYGSMKARAVLRDVGRVLEIPLPQVDRIAKLVPEELKITLKKAIDQEPRLRDAMREESIQKLLKVAQTLEGLARHKSTHAAGVVISPKPMVEYLPVCIGPDKEILTQYDMKYTEMTGLIKFDFLGLKTLTVIDRALKLIKQDIGLDVHLNKLPTDDQKTYDLLCAGSSLGVFQLESDGMRELLIKMAPEQFTDLIALVALYRPGPLDSGMVDQFVETKHGRRPAEYPVPQIKEVLRETYGVIVYQEQVMKISNILASYSLGDADILRRAMGKKIPEVMEAERGKFMAGAKVNGIPEERAAYVFDLMAKFAAYGFNKCVIGSTRLLDAETGKLLTVEELHQQPRRFMVHALGEDYKLRPRKVLDVFENGIKPVFELRTAQGHRITATANHPFRTLDGWTLLGDLKPGDRIAAPRRLIVQGGKYWPRHELICLAGLLAEGNVCHPSSLYFFGNDAVLVHDFAEAAAQFPESKARVYQRSDGRFEVCVNTGHDMRFRKGERSAEEEAAPPVRSGAWHWAEQLGILGKKAVEKAVPPEVFLLGDADIELFLGRLWAGDGFIANHDQFTPFYATSSFQLAYDVQTLLLRLGIPSGVHEKQFRYRGEMRPGYTVHLVGEGTAETFIRRVVPHALGRERQAEQLRHHLEGKQPGLTSKDTIPAEVRTWVDAERRSAGLTWSELERRSGVCMKEFMGKGSAGKRGFRRSTLARLAGFFASSRLAEIAESDIFWDSVAVIEPRGEQQTYDLTVEEDHNFVADGLIVHNSHSAAYALVAYHTAYLKAHYPAQFLAALLSCDVDNTDKVVRYINECRQMSIEVLPPDINESYHDFTVIKDRIRFGLAAVKGVGGAALDSVIEERRKAPYTSLADFCGRVDSSRVNRKVLENLIKAGAFDSMRAKRAQLMEVLDKTIEQAKTVQRDRMSGQMSLFGMGGGAAKSGASVAAEIKLPDVEEWAPLVKLGYEKETVGFFLTGHPLDGVIDHIRLVADSDLAAMESWKDGQTVRVGGLIQRFKEHRSKKGDRMAFTVLEDMTASVEVVVFPETFARCSHLLGSEQPLIVQGTVQVSERGANIIADSVLPLNEALEQLMEKAVIRLRSDRVGRPQLTALKDLLYQFHGTLPIKITLHFDGRGEADIEPHPDMAVRPCADFFQQLRQQFGKDCLIVQTKKAEARKRKSEGGRER